MSESELTESFVIEDGGWHPRYAQVLAIATHLGIGLAIVDGNGDGAELEIEYWECVRGAWEPVGSAGGGPLEADWRADDEPYEPWSSNGFDFYAHGVAPEADQVRVVVEGEVYNTPTGKKGAWAFVRSTGRRLT